MKKVFSSLGKSILYFLTYLGGQLLVQAVVSVILGYKSMSPNGELDNDKYMQLLNENSLLLVILSGALTLLIYLIVTLVRKKSWVKEISLNKMKFKEVYVILFMGISCNFLVMMLISELPFSEAMVESYETSSSMVAGKNVAMAWIATVIMAPIVEEVVFRGFVYSRLKEGTGIIVASIITSLVFGLAHGTVIGVTYAFITSLLFIFVRERTNSLWASILFHFAFNFVGMAVNTWSAFFESLSPMVVLACSVVVFGASIVWFMNITKKEKKVLDTQVSEPVNA